MSDFSQCWALFSRTEAYPGMFNPRARFVWVGLKLLAWTKQLDSGLGLLHVNSGASLVWTLLALITGSVVCTWHFLWWWLEKLVSKKYKNKNKAARTRRGNQPAWIWLYISLPLGRWSLGAVDWILLPSSVFFWQSCIIGSLLAQCVKSRWSLSSVAAVHVE